MEVDLLNASIDTTLNSTRNTTQTAVVHDGPEWIHVSELYIPMLPFRLHPNWIEAKVRIELPLQKLKNKTKPQVVHKRLLQVAGKRVLQQPHSLLSEAEIRETVLTLMENIVDLQPDTDDQMLWLIQFMSRFILQKYKPSSYLYYPGIVETITMWDPDIWDDENLIHQMAVKVRHGIGTKICNFIYVSEALALLNVQLHHIFIIISCVMMRELVLGEDLKFYEPITPKEVLSLATTFNLKTKNIDMRYFNDFLRLFAVYLKLVNHTKDLIPKEGWKMPMAIFEKYYKPASELKVQFEQWTNDAISLVDSQFGQQMPSDHMAIREVLEFDLLVTIKGNKRGPRSILWGSQQNFPSPVKK